MMDKENGINARVRVLETLFENLAQRFERVEKEVHQTRIDIALLKWKVAVISAIFSSAATIGVQLMLNFIIKK